MDSRTDSLQDIDEQPIPMRKNSGPLSLFNFLTTLKEQYKEGKIKSSSSLNGMSMQINDQIYKSSEANSEDLYEDIGLELYGVFIFLNKVTPHMDAKSSFR